MFRLIRRGANALLFLVVVGVFLSQNTVHGKAATASDSPWLINSPKLEKIKTLAGGETIPYSIGGNRDCYMRPVTTRPARILKIWPFTQDEIKSMGCVVDTGYGAISTTGLLQRQGTDVFGTIGYLSIYGASVPIVPIPNSPVLMYSSGNSRYGSYFRFIDNPGSYISSAGIYTGEIQHSLNGGGSILTDRSGANVPLRYDTIATSQNGQWIVADFPGISLVRVNTQTREVLPFGTSYNYASGYSFSSQMAVSEDGRYGVSASSDFGRFSLFDLSTCDPTPDNITQPVNCQRADLLPIVKQAVTNFTGASNIRFIGTDAMTFYAGSRNSDGSITNSQYVIYTGNKPSLNSLQYLALGDSFSAGQGAFSYKALTDTPENRCHISLVSYPYLIASALNMTLYQSVACSGAVMRDMNSKDTRYSDKYSQAKGMSDIKYNDYIFNNYLPGYRPQSIFLDKHPQVTTLTIGGNDIGFSDIIIRCASIDTCYGYYEDRLELANQINSHFNDLTDLYTELTKAAGPFSKIYVIGYPSIVAENGNCGLNVHFNNDEIIFANKLTSYLNDVIRRAALNAGVYYVDATDALAGHRLCETDAGNIAVNGLTAGDDAPSFINGPFGSESYHPNALGHQLLKQKILAQTANFTQPMPNADSTSQPPIVATSLPLLDAPHANRTTSSVSFVKYEGIPLYKNTKVDLTIGIPTPLTPVPAQIWINSDPVQIGTVTPNADGSINAQVTIPSQVEPGFHTVNIYGKNVIGDTLNIQTIVYVGDSTDDLNGNGIPNSVDPCPANQSSGVDSDHDGIDDSCDSDLKQTDTTPPKVTGRPVDQPDGKYDWYSHDVTINWHSTDPEPSSGTPTLPPAVVANLEGLNTYTSGQSCDPVGNCSTGNLDIKLDKTKPIIDFTISPNPNSAGWNSGPATITFNCTDVLSGIEDCTPPRTITNDGVVVVTGTATDRAGNQASINAFVSIDSSTPEISAANTPQPNTHDWFNSDVTTNFICGGSISGILSCSSPILTTTEGKDKPVTGTVTNNAGGNNSTSTSINIDKTPPNIEPRLSQQPNAEGWNNTPVTVTFDCSDTLSNIDTCTPPITVTSAGGTIVTGTALDKAGNTRSINVFIMIDYSSPSITTNIYPKPNENGWNNSNVSIDFTCDDEHSGIKDCTDKALLSNEGVGQSATGTATDNASNQTFATTDIINIDKTAPTLTPISATSSTKSTNDTVSFSTMVVDDLSGLGGGEYYIGDNDPGLGHGATMMVEGSTLTTTFGRDFPTGVYKISIRGYDRAGNWGNTVSNYLVVYDATGPKFTGKRSIIPSLNNGDGLPGLNKQGQTDKATFGFSVKYDKFGGISRNSDFGFSYNTGTNCQNSKKAINCHTFELNTTEIGWMTTEGANNSAGIFQGRATLNVDDTKSVVLFRVQGVDGERLDAISSDKFQLEIYPEGSNPNIAKPIYTVHSSNILRGNIKINR